jgi:hypothetical protein
MEYLLSLADLAPAGAAPPALRGRLGCLWRDGDGWRVLLFTRGPTGERLREGPLRAAVLAAEAVRRQTGAWPREVALYAWADGTAVRKDGRRLPHRRILPEVAARLAALCGERSSEDRVLTS